MAQKEEHEEGLVLVRALLGEVERALRGLLEGSDSEAAHRFLQVGGVYVMCIVLRRAPDRSIDRSVYRLINWMLDRSMNQ